VFFICNYELLHVGGGELQFPLMQYEVGLPAVTNPLLQMKRAVAPSLMMYTFPLLGFFRLEQFSAVNMKKKTEE